MKRRFITALGFAPKGVGMEKKNMKHYKTTVDEVMMNLNIIGECALYKRFRTTNAYIGVRQRFMINKEEFNVTPIKSYSTVVAFADNINRVYYEVHKYSRTTSKQVTQIYNSEFSDYERVFVP